MNNAEKPQLTIPRVSCMFYFNHIKITKMKIINYLFPKKSQWFDVGMFEHLGYYKIIQMRYVLSNNKKTFRVVNIGFINVYTQKVEIFKKSLSIGKNCEVAVV
jgi:hypothetical protein